MIQISRVEVFLDDNVPDYMEGIIRIGSVQYEFKSIGTEDDKDDLDLPDFVDNTEFRSEDEIISYIAKELNISEGIIEIMG